MSTASVINIDKPRLRQMLGYVGFGVLTTAFGCTWWQSWLLCLAVVWIVVEPELP